MDLDLLPFRGVRMVGKRASFQIDRHLDLALGYNVLHLSGLG
jgi:hypothetical protein